MEHAIIFILLCSFSSSTKEVIVFDAKEEVVK
jgi:hypothetical protein